MPKHERTPDEFQAAIFERLGLTVRDGVVYRGDEALGPIESMTVAGGSAGLFIPFFNKEAITPGGANTGKTTRLARVCRKCGDTLPDGAQFCIACGAEAPHA